MDCGGVGVGEDSRCGKGESLESTGKEPCREEILRIGCVFF